MSNSNEHLQAAMKSVETDIENVRAQYTYLQNTIDRMHEKLGRYNREVDKVTESLDKLKKLHVALQDVYRDNRQTAISDYALKDIPTDELLQDIDDDEDIMPSLPPLTANTAVAKVLNNE